MYVLQIRLALDMADVTFEVSVVYLGDVSIIFIAFI